MVIYKTDLEIKKRIDNIAKIAHFSYVKSEDVVAVESKGSTGRAVARIYAFPRIWQEAFGLNPRYVIEIVSEKFDKYKKEDQDKVLIHELMHIPKSFSGALVPHNCFGRKHICSKTVERIYKQYKNENR